MRNPAWDMTGRKTITLFNNPTSAINIYEITNGKVLVPSDMTGVEKVIYDPDTHTIAEVFDLYAPVGLDDGVGVAQNISTQERVLIFTGPSPINHDIWTGHLVMCYSTVSVKITGSNPDRYQTFYVPVFIT